MFLEPNYNAMPTVITQRQGRAVSLFVAGCIALACALCFALPTGYSYGSAVLCLASVPLLIWYRPALALSRADGCFIGALILYFGLHVLLNIHHGLSSRHYEEPSRFLLGVFVVLSVMGFRPPARFWWGGLIVGAIVGGVVALWQVFIDGRVRAGGYMNPIQFGNVCVLMAGLCLAGLGWAQHRQHAGRWSAWLCLAATMGIVGSLLSGARGGWIALPVMLCLLYWVFRRQMRRRRLAAGLLSLLALLMALYALPQTGISERIDRAASEVGLYFDEQQVGQSVGIRLEMWRGAIALADEYPLAGWGEQAYVEPLVAQIDSPKTQKIMARYNHMHNDLLDTQIKRGLLGTLALLMVYLVPLVLFARELVRAQRNQHSVRAFALSGVLLVVSVMLFGLTQAFFRHNSGVTLYAFFLTVIWGYMRCAQQRDGVDE